jgi:hypothetical protein
MEAFILIIITVISVNEKKSQVDSMNSKCMIITSKFSFHA